MKKLFKSSKDKKGTEATENTTSPQDQTPVTPNEPPVSILPPAYSNQPGSYNDDLNHRTSAVNLSEENNPSNDGPGHSANAPMYDTSPPPYEMYPSHQGTQYFPNHGYPSQGPSGAPAPPYYSYGQPLPGMAPQHPTMFQQYGPSMGQPSHGMGMHYQQHFQGMNPNQQEHLSHNIHQNYGGNPQYQDNRHLQSSGYQPQNETHEQRPTSQHSQRFKTSKEQPAEEEESDSDNNATTKTKVPVPKPRKPKQSSETVEKPTTRWTDSFKGPKRDINILILGETGVGKSTWINGFRNFLAYETLREAENSELHTLIPSEFTVCDENFEEILVTTGRDKNEVSKAGQSATQEAKVYQFDFGNMHIKLIDTPGIGDTRGIDQDNKNFKNILSTLSHHEELHGICILLKPNNARLTVMFRFCIKELLTHIHRDASKNIMFCFTNSRGTFYRPGDTLPALKNLLDENKDVKIPVNRNTVYCYDSEAYRFLAAIKNSKPVKFDESERSNFEKSWEKSLDETKRMLEYILGLPPHPVKNTLSLNHARELVLKLARPLAEISMNINVNKTIIQEEKELIERTKEDISKLKKQLHTTMAELKIERIDFPKTVCSNARCIKTSLLAGTNGKQAVEYVTICHDHCYLDGVTEDCVGHSGLLECWAMVNGKCKHSRCGHSYREHLHIYYDSVQVTKQVENQAVKEALDKNLSASEMKQNMIKEKNRKIAEFEEEQKIIEKISARFAYFLKSNAITPYNDALEQYLDHLIREENNKVSNGANPATLENLQIMKASYLSEKDILESEMRKGGSSKHAPGPAEIEIMVEQLKSLKYSGKSLQDALDCVQHTKTLIYETRIVQKTKYGQRYGYEPNKSSSIFTKFTKIFS